MKEHFLLTKTREIYGDSGRAEKGVHTEEKNVRMSDQTGAKSYRVLQAGSLKSMTSDLETDIWICFTPFLHFLQHLLFNTFPPDGRWSTTRKYLSRSCLQLGLQCSLIYRTTYSYFSYNPSRVQDIPPSGSQASKEHSCISTVSVLPATVYVAPGVCRARQ